MEKWTELTLIQILCRANDLLTAGRQLTFANLVDIALGKTLASISVNMHIAHPCCTSFEVKSKVSTFQGGSNCELRKAEETGIKGLGSVSFVWSVCTLFWEDVPGVG